MYQLLMGVPVLSTAGCHGGMLEIIRTTSSSTLGCRPSTISTSEIFPFVSTQNLTRTLTFLNDISPVLGLKLSKMYLLRESTPPANIACEARESSTNPTGKSSSTSEGWTARVLSGGTIVCAEAAVMPERAKPAATPKIATFCNELLRIESACSNCRTSLSHRGHVPWHSPSYPHSGISNCNPLAAATSRRTAFK